MISNSKVTQPFCNRCERRSVGIFQFWATEAPVQGPNDGKPLCVQGPEGFLVAHGSEDSLHDQLAGSASAGHHPPGSLLVPGSLDVGRVPSRRQEVGADRRWLHARRAAVQHVPDGSMGLHDGRRYDKYFDSLSVYQIYLDKRELIIYIRDRKFEQKYWDTRKKFQQKYWDTHRHLRRIHRDVDRKLGQNLLRCPKEMMSIWHPCKSIETPPGSSTGKS